MKKGSGGRWVFFNAVIIVFIFLSISPFVIEQILPQSCGKPKKHQLRWLGQHETPPGAQHSPTEGPTLPPLWNPAPPAWPGFPSLTAKLESVIFVKQSCPALPDLYI